MKIIPLSKTKIHMQDGAVWGEFLFRFHSCGKCAVYKLADFETNAEPAPYSEFVLDRSEAIVPHSNAVTFGAQFYAKDDEFPLIYTNIYNNYANSSSKLNGVCLVYRLQREDNKFKSTLVQVIEVGFAYERGLWLSGDNTNDARPYGNFVVDRNNKMLYAFTMIDDARVTRYFSFKLPCVTHGEMYPINGVKRVVLKKEDIVDTFDCPYHNYLQGACFYNDKIYSVEGFTDSTYAPPAIRIIDVKAKKQIFFKEFKDFGINNEPELIEFKNDICYYSNHMGDMYKIDFEI